MLNKNEVGTILFSLRQNVLSSLGVLIYCEIVEPPWPLYLSTQSAAKQQRSRHISLFNLIIQNTLFTIIYTRLTLF